MLNIRLSRNSRACEDLVNHCFGEKQSSGQFFRELNLHATILQACNEYLLSTVISRLGLEQTLDKSQPEYLQCLQLGFIAS
jgi:hypothetical protein